MNASKDHVSDVAASVRQRLLNWSRERRTDFQLTLVRYASERFLYRLSRSTEADRFILKGALLLRLWTEQEFRPTRDVDFLGLGSEDHEAIRSAIEEICIVDCPEDGLEFDHTMMRVESIRNEQEYGGVRVKLQGRLGVTRIPLQVDIGFGDVVTPAPIEENYPTLLDLPAPRLKTYPRETFIAEKFEAMVRLGPSNSRMKDFWDVAAVAQQFAFDGEVLCQAIKATFTRRGTPFTEEVPDALRPAFYQDARRIGLWRSFQQRVQPGIPMPTSFGAVGELVKSFLMPIWDNLVDGLPFGMAWLPGGPWQSSVAIVGAEAQETRNATVQRGVNPPKGAPRRFRPYPEYKESDVEWLGKIPMHWEVKRLKHVARLHTGGTPQGLLDDAFDQEGVPWIKPDDLLGDRGISEASRKLALAAAKAIGTARSGALLVCGIGTVGKYGVAGQVVCTNQQINSIMLNSAVEDHYGAFAVSCLEQEFLSRSNKVTIAICNKAQMAQAVLPIPSLLEQRTIASFLDQETAKIDVLVVKKERLVELLEEKRTAIITRAVTKGLDPNVPVKDSSVEWLGEIPAHWEIKQIRNIANSLQTGPFGSQLHSEDYSPGGIPVINPSHLRDGYITPDMNCAVDQATALRLKQHELCEGDIIFARRGEMGRCALVTRVEAGWLCGTGSLRIRPNLDLVHPPFLNRFLSISGVRDGLLLESVGATMDNLNTTILGRVVLLVPPVEEQRAIDVFLDRETSKIDALSKKIRDGIERLKEFRTALISAAVTGKIVVREEGSL